MQATEMVIVIGIISLGIVLGFEEFTGFMLFPGSVGIDGISGTADDVPAGILWALHQKLSALASNI